MYRSYLKFYFSLYLIFPLLHHKNVVAIEKKYNFDVGERKMKGLEVKLYEIVVQYFTNQKDRKEKFLSSTFFF